MASEPTFEIRSTSAVEPGERLVVGMAGPAVAGLTAADYLVNHVETTQIGHARTRGLPALTPFAQGEPRHPVRLYSTRDSTTTVLISEVFLPVWVDDDFADALLGWADAAGIGEITVLHGAPFPHNEAEHVVFHVATEAYRERHFADGEPFGPLPSGFFDGVVGELLERSMDGDAPPTGVLVTPTHVPEPDLEGAIRLLDAFETLYGIEVDEGDLRARADEFRRYYEELSERMQSLKEEAGRHGEYPADRMFM